MLLHRLYYQVKPLLPDSFWRRMRRYVATRKRDKVADVWPILPGSETVPPGWPGWPEGKKFGFILTHDVEGRLGLNQALSLMELEKKFGFRASFNFVPEGEYRLTDELRGKLLANGFEVGVHDFNHDGNLYGNRHGFARKASRINHYLAEWGAVGFRSGFMRHNLDWLHDVHAAYDASTFDTDPFEPQPDGAHTIFPFWVPGRRGYFELPYTLAQDSTLFLLLGESNIDLWLKKLDWIVAHGGMVLVNIHPDYIDFSSGSPAKWKYSYRMIEQFLDYVRTRYGGQFWHGTARELTEHLAGHHWRNSNGHDVAGKNGRKIWIDLENTPHVPLFIPIIDTLKERGYEIFLTARDAYQVCELAEKMGLNCVRVGKHHGKSNLLKGLGIIERSARMAPLVMREGPMIGLSHGSRTQALVCNCLGIPSIHMADYEHSAHPPMMRPKWEILPEVIKNTLVNESHVRRYPGIKEDVYVPRFKPSGKLRQELGISEEDILIVSRPPASEAHYYVPESSQFFDAFMDYACQAKGVRLVLLPRNKRQGEALLQEKPHWFLDERTVIPKAAVDGLDLIWDADLVVSGGGTMNREAAALRVPVYSVFRGALGAVDAQLEKEGRLVMVRTLDQARQIPLCKRDRATVKNVSPPALVTVVKHVEEIISLACS